MRLTRTKSEVEGNNRNRGILRGVHVISDWRMKWLSCDQTREWKSAFVGSGTGGGNVINPRGVTQQGSFRTERHEANDGGNLGSRLRQSQEAIARSIRSFVV